MGGRAKAGTVAVMAMLLTSTGLGKGVQSEERRWCPEPEARQFDFWVGEWDVENLNRAPGGDAWLRTGTATNRVRFAVGGCAVVEHWRGRAFPSAGHIAGFSVRTWDPAASEWDLVLLWPIGGPPRFGNPRGGFRDGRGEFLNRIPRADGDTLVSRLVFSDVTDRSLRWSNGTSTDGGESWTSTWRMEFERRPPVASALWNGTTMSTARCPGEEHRAFDPFLGEWEGTRITPAGDSVALTTRLVRILDGCAVMERSRAGDGSWEAFAVRAFEVHAGVWTEYATASDRRGLRRREGTTNPGGALLTDVEAVGGVFLRTRWATDGPALVRVRARADAADGPWTALDSARYTRLPSSAVGGG